MRLHYRESAAAIDFNMLAGARAPLCKFAFNLKFQFAADYILQFERIDKTENVLGDKF